MESPEEFTTSNDHTMIVKGKRTKRQRPSSPPAAMTSSSSSGGGNSSSGGGGRGDVKYYYSSIPSPTTSTSTDQEDEDMANCLILLAQGTTLEKLEKFSTISHRRYFTRDTATTTTTTTTTGKAGFYVYECKTCNRTFPSFQALGGHRASHKKPKVMTVLATTIDHQDEKQEEEEEEEEEEAEEKIISLPISIQTTTKATITSSSHVNHKSNKVHECSICGSEFSSGQALGGHMRRHRAHPPGTINQISMSFDTITNFMESQEGIIKRPRNVLQLDLNLPAPPEIEENDHGEEIRDSKFHFFSAPALVGCHY